MEKFASVTSIYARVPVQDVDTDLIIPAEFLTSISKSGYGENLFRRLRDNDPTFFMNDPQFTNTKILVAGKNFGCGSSREHAVWALVGWGIKVVIAESFADIFTENAAKNGLLLITQSADKIASLFSAPKDATVTISLSDQTMICSDGTKHAFEYDTFKKHCLIEGVDELSYLLSKKELITKFFQNAPVQKYQQRL